MSQMVSVIVPIYNHERYIAACLDSIAADPYPNVEIVAIDDGSVDQSYEVAERWGTDNATRVKRFYLARQSNHGLTRTLNRLISLCSGDFIALVASDDYLLSGGIQARVEALERHPDWLAVFGDSHLIDSAGDCISDSGTVAYANRTPRMLHHRKLMERELVLRWWMPGPVLMFRRDAFESVGGFKESISFEDRDMYLRLVARHALGFVDYPVAAYRMRPPMKGLSDAQLTLLREEIEVDGAMSSRFKGYLAFCLKLRATYTKSRFLAPRSLVRILTLLPLALLWKSNLAFHRIESWIHTVLITEKG